jgi:uncharacterized protein YyaL (SSP411 family)
LIDDGRQIRKDWKVMDFLAGMKFLNQIAELAEQEGHHPDLHLEGYLLQHAHNPVNWFPWSEEALQLAKREDKPLFLSIGYSACHWCHVMERESFEDSETAEILNKHFIAVKVDREEHPDLDEIYMTAVQISKLLDNHDYFSKAERLLASAASHLHDHPRASLRLLCAADYYLSPTLEIAIAGRHDSVATKSLLEDIHQKFIPNKIMALIDPDADWGSIEPVIPLLTGKQMLSGRPTIYLCRGASCQEPIVDKTLLKCALEDVIQPG